MFILTDRQYLIRGWTAIILNIFEWYIVHAKKIKDWLWFGESMKIQDG